MFIIADLSMNHIWLMLGLLDGAWQHRGYTSMNGVVAPAMEVGAKRIFARSIENRNICYTLIFILW